MDDYVLVTVPQPSFPSLLTVQPYHDLRRKIVVIDKTDYDRIFRLAPYDEEYLMTSIALMQLDKFHLLYIMDYQQLFGESSRFLGKMVARQALDILQRQKDMLEKLAEDIYSSWVEYARNDARRTILQSLDQNETIKFFDESKRASLNELDRIRRGKINDVVQGSIRKVIIKTVASNIIAKEISQKLGKEALVSDCQEYSYTAIVLSDLSKKFHDIPETIKWRSLPNTFKCLSSSYINKHQDLFYLLRELAPDLGIQKGLSPPYYMGSAIASLIHHFDLSTVFWRLNSIAQQGDTEQFRKDVKDALEKLDSFYHLFPPVRRSTRYLAEYVCEESRDRSLRSMPSEIRDIITPSQVKLITKILESWIRQYDILNTIDNLKKKLSDSAVFVAALIFCDPFYQVEKHKNFYYVWKWYNRIFKKPEAVDLDWYKTQRVFTTWLEKPQWYEQTRYEKTALISRQSEGR